MRLPDAAPDSASRVKRGLTISLACSITNCIVAPIFAMTFLFAGGTLARAANVDCMDTATALEYWRPIREQAPTAEDPADELALELVPCLGSPNSELRDQTAYELFTFWLRGTRLTDDTRRTLLGDLSEVMAKPPAAIPGNSSFARSFSALILSEIMRSDSNQPFMSDSERQALLDRAIQSLEQENDFRGLDAEFGWIHPVAHLADLLWRFALHPDTTAVQAESILDAVRDKVAPTVVAYHFNESDRLARVAATIISRNLVAPDKVATWVMSFRTPTSMAKWSDAFMSPAGMAELHNTKLFLRALADQLNGGDIDWSISEALTETVRRFTQLI